MGCLARQGLALLLLVATLLCLLGPASCASQSREGFYYTVRPGDNLYRIGRRYGVPADALAEANDIRDVRKLTVGTRLWIPGRRAQARKGRKPDPKAGSRPSGAAQVRREAGLNFIWPVSGTLTSRFGTRNGHPHEGLDLGAPRGTPICAAEAGRVIHSGRLGDYGKTVIIKHAGHYRTVYAHARKTLVRKGDFVERGQRIAEVGTTGRASGPHLHFEIRRWETPLNPLRYLP